MCCQFSLLRFILQKVSSGSRIILDVTDSKVPAANASETKRQRTDRVVGLAIDHEKRMQFVIILW